jgi:hypothetical protein
LTGGDNGLIVDPYIFSGEMVAADLEVTNSVIFPSASSIILGDGNSLYDYI